MIDLTEMNIMFTLNGEMLISDSGSEMAFKDIEIGEGKNNCVHREKTQMLPFFSLSPDSSRLHPCVQSGPLPSRQD